MPDSNIDPQAQPTPYVRPKRKNQAVLLSLIGFLIIVSFFSGFIIAVSVTVKAPSNPYTITTNSLADVSNFDESLYIEVWETLRDNYVDTNKINDQELFYGALRGMVAAVGDPYTVFLNPELLDEFKSELSGSFDGIGAEIGMKDDRLIVVAPLAGSPAEKSGLRAGDIILSINRADATNFSVDQAVALIRGKAGTDVILEIYRLNGDSSTETVTITRDKISIPSVRLTVEDSIAILAIYNFNHDSTKQFVQALTKLSSHDVRGVIIDLRNNPGGFLENSIEMASAWIPENNIVVREVYRDPTLNREYKAIKQIHAPEVPTVVLLNQGSASASEILAGALQDYDIATIMGMTSFGKGSVQDLRTLSDGSGLKVTISQWLTPIGRIINDAGIEPDFVIPLNSDDLEQNIDTQLESAKIFLQSDE